jgi:hypothetical protein
MDPANTPALVAATLVHNVDIYRRHHIPVTEQSLAYSYNPPGGGANLTNAKGSRLFGSCSKRNASVNPWSAMRRKSNRSALRFYFACTAER